MYDYDYEEDILLALRVLKFLHDQNPNSAKSLAEFHKSFDPNDEIFMLVDEVLWEIFDDVQFSSDEEWESSVVYFSHPTINRFYELSRQLENSRHGNYSGWQRKINDVVEYFVCSSNRSVYEFHARFPGGHVEIETRLSPDCYEPLLFANALVDLLIYCQREVERLETLLKQAKQETECRQEAA